MNTRFNGHSNSTTDTSINTGTQGSVGGSALVKDFEHARMCAFVRGHGRIRLHAFIWVYNLCLHTYQLTFQVNKSLNISYRFLKKNPKAIQINLFLGNLSWLAYQF